jgi:hypothetical protein
VRRRLFNLATALSLVLTIACAFCWGRSLYVEDLLRADTDTFWWYVVRSGFGSITVIFRPLELCTR